MPSTLDVTNVATVPFRSPFRYPGGKTWLIPQIRVWLKSKARRPRLLIEPFAGGAIVGLTAAFEELVEHVLLVELDADIASVWLTILGDRGDELADQIPAFELCAENIQLAIAGSANSIFDNAFATIVRNRISRGGILAPGAGIVKNGENGRGLLSRWYPQTIQRRIHEIVASKDRLSFEHGDAFEITAAHADETDAVFFVDPPYTVAGRRLYTHSEIDHEALFRLMSQVSGDFIMTYDDSREICHLASKFKFDTFKVPMKTTHHTVKHELIIGQNLDWLRR